METTKLTDQQSLRIAELPRDYRVVAIDRSTPVIRKPSGQLLRIQPNGRLVAATIAARQKLEESRLDRLHARSRPQIITPYTTTME
jgi:hypothetical protein